MSDEQPIRAALGNPLQGKAMTTLRETLAMALAYQRPLEDNSQDWKDSPEAIKEAFRADAGRVILALAAWEPSDAACQVLAGYTLEKDNPEKLFLARQVIKRILQTMAEP